MKRKEEREQRKEERSPLSLPLFGSTMETRKGSLRVLPFFLDTVLHPSIFSSLCNLSFNYKTTTLASNQEEHKMKASQSHYGILMDHTLFLLDRVISLCSLWVPHLLRELLNHSFTSPPSLCFLSFSHMKH